MAEDETYRHFDPWMTPPVQEDSRESILDAYYFQVEKVNLHATNFGHFSRTIVHSKRGDTIAILGIGGDGKIPFVEQYRIPSHRWTLELPAGHGKNASDDPITTAKARLREEAGLTAKHYNQIMRFLNVPSYSTHYTSILLATGLSDVSREVKGADMRRSSVRWLTFDEAYSLMLSGKILDAKTVIALLLLRIRIDEGRPFESLVEKGNLAPGITIEDINDALKKGKNTHRTSKHTRKPQVNPNSSPAARFTEK